MPKDFYESELKVGDKVAFNHGGSVRLGKIKSIAIGKTRPMNRWEVPSPFYKIVIEHLFSGGTSTVKNLDSLIKLNIDALSPNYLTTK